MRSRGPRHSDGNIKVVNAAQALILAFPQVELGDAQPKFEALCAAVGVYPPWHVATIRQAKAAIDPNAPALPESGPPAGGPPPGYTPASSRGMPFDVSDL